MTLFTQRTKDQADDRLPWFQMMVVEIISSTGINSLTWLLGAKIRRKVREIEACTDELPMWSERSSFKDLR